MAYKSKIVENKENQSGTTVEQNFSSILKQQFVLLSGIYAASKNL